MSKERTAGDSARVGVQEARLNPLVQEVRQALLAGSQMSTSLNSTLVTFDALMKRFGVGETNASAAATHPPSEPFRILDYGEAAHRVEGAARELRGLLAAVNETLGSSNLTQLPARVAPGSPTSPGQRSRPA